MHTQRASGAHCLMLAQRKRPCVETTRQWLSPSLNQPYGSLLAGSNLLWKLPGCWMSTVSTPAD